MKLQTKYYDQPVPGELRLLDGEAVKAQWSARAGTFDQKRLRMRIFDGISHPVIIHDGICILYANDAATYSGSAYLHGSSGGLSGGQLVNDAPITGLSAVNSSPTRLMNITFFTATITTGSNVSYTWAFGDGQATVGAQVSHRYTQTGTYTTTVTALNSTGSISTTTVVTIKPAKLYLPLILCF